MINSSKDRHICIALVRGAFLNNFEGQNYHTCELINNEVSITGFTSYKSIHQQFPFKVVRLPSMADFNILGRWGRAIANRTFGDIQNLFRIEKFSSRFDIFHTADPHYYYSYQLAKLRRDNRIRKLIVTSWETIPHNNETINVKKRNKYFVMENTDHFVCHTLKAKTSLIEEGADERKISVIRLGIDLEVFKYKQIKPNNKIITILFVGRLVPEKGIIDVYEAFKLIKNLKSKSQDIKLRIIGNGILKNKLLKQIEKDGLGGLVSIINVPYEIIAEEYQKADIFIAPSKKSSTWEEQYGMVFLEAMGSGLPIITYDTGAIRELVGNAGLFSQENDVKGLSRSLLSLISDKYKRLKIGTIGRERASTMFDCKKTAHELIRIYYE